MKILLQLFFYDYEFFNDIKRVKLEVMFPVLQIQ